VRPALRGAAVLQRLRTAAGPEERVRGGHPALRRLLAGERPIVFGDGLQTRDFVHVSDVVRANLLAAQSEKAPGETINVGSGHSATLVELIQLLRQAVGPQAAGITIEHQAPRVGDLRASSADISKARALLGYVPRVQLAEGLAGVVDFFRSSIKKAA